MVIVGIDFGTHSTVAVDAATGEPLDFGGGGPLLLRTTVAYSVEGDSEGTVGVRPEDALPGEVVVTAPKGLLGRRFGKHRPVGNASVVAGDGGRCLVELPDGRKLPPERVCGRVFRHLRERLAAAGGSPPFKAVVTVPAYFSDAQRKATMDAAKVGGWEVLRVLNEPTAAALHCCGGGGETTTALVFDLGAGTVDCSVVRVEEGVHEVLATRGDCDLGSQDLDFRIRDLFRQDMGGSRKIDEAELLAAARQAKEGLGDGQYATVAYRGKPLRLSLDRLRRNCLDDVVRRLVAVARGCLGDLKGSDAATGVLFVGGGCALRPLREAVASALGLPELPCGDPLTAVARGAAAQAAALTQKSPDAPLLLDVVPLTLGLDCCEGWMTPVVERGTKLPASATETFTTWTDNQTAVDVQVYEGERERAKDNLLLGVFDLCGLPQAPAGELQIDVQFDVSVDGFLTVSATEKSSGKTRSVAIKADQWRVDPGEVERMCAEAESHSQEDKAARQNAEAHQDMRRYLRKMAKVLRYEASLEQHADAAMSEVTEAAAWLEAGPHTTEEVDARHKSISESLDALLEATLGADQKQNQQQQE